MVARGDPERQEAGRAREEEGEEGGGEGAAEKQERIKKAREAREGQQRQQPKRMTMREVCRAGSVVKAASFMLPS